MSRITLKDCQFLVDRVNKLRKKSHIDDGYIMIDRAYGGHAVQMKEGAGYRDSSKCGYTTKSIIYTFLKGMDFILTELENEK